MKQITSKTASLVSINFQVATLGQRAGAFLIDFLILGGGILLLLLLFNFLGLAGDWLIYLIFLIILFYSLLFEIFTRGSTPGKKAIGLQVLKFTGAPPSVLDYVIRWVFRIIDLYGSLFMVATTFSISSAYGQRLGDVMAGTTVIKFDKKETVSLNDLLEMKTKENYSPKYPQVEKLNDKDMLLVKSTIFRAQRNVNQAHKTALWEMVDKLKFELDINEKVKDPLLFLKDLLRDYVILTR
ncbi:RDD family protein [bacterium SCSIO 12643]|nr:RDD family protein [bacterium SCSIO 12643]